MELSRAIEVLERFLRGERWNDAYLAQAIKRVLKELELNVI